ERISRGVQIGIAIATLAAAIGAHLPGRPMAGQRILLVTRDSLCIHAGEEIVRLVIFANVVEAEVPVLARVLAALRGAVRALVLAVRPFAFDGCIARLRLLLRALPLRLHANGIEEF